VDELVVEIGPLDKEARVAKEMNHREKQVGIVLDQTLAKLSPPERTALEYAALLPPDTIPWPWLRALVEEEHPEVATPRRGYPAGIWTEMRRRLEGLRLLTPGDHVEIDRLHRMVAAHVRERLAAGDDSEGRRPENMPAQGNALGSPAPQNPSPERVTQNPDVPPLQGLGESAA
jgi:hypothetical protein